MKRRSFLKTSLLGTAVAGILPVAAHAEEREARKKSKREFYELRVYTLKNKEQEKIVESYFENAAIPALNGIGCKNVGVFKELKPDGQSKIFVVIPFKTMDDFIQAETRLTANDEYMEAASGYLNAPPAEPAYERIESSLHIAFVRLPKAVVPEKRPRIFEMWRYESANEMACQKKIEMFNEGGGIEVFKRVGLNPVFFGETLIGAARPNLTYLLTYDSMAAHDRTWKWFGKDPEWKKIKAMPEYADEKIVSRVTTTFLIPAECSQL